MDHIVTAEEDGRAVRDILRRSMSVSYSAMKSAKWDDRVLLNGIPVPVSARTSAGDTVSFLEAEKEAVYPVRPYPLPLTVPYLDEYLMVVDKPAPLASQSSAGHPDDSLENAVFSYFGCPDHFIYRPVNRLDKGTSGLMVIARTAHAQQLLQRMLHTDRFRRGYLAVTEGIPEPRSGVIDLPIAKVPEASVKRFISPDGKPSVTHYTVLQENGSRALVSLRLETGRTHQIRVHMSASGCPVCGDFLYGTELPELPGRFALHSSSLSLIHPVTGEELTLSSELPAELSALLHNA
ncbi:MAG: RluA family pseudouridine synthase [Clostridia bacterium]|nr:RluA family pseudouridine synthase [Clostridia bacterium]